MAWYDSLTAEQRTAASHIGTHARLLAGPGTGKTRVISRRVQFLIEECHVPSTGILVLTFTRAAAHELRQRLAGTVKTEPPPRVSTLHSFALRQLLLNSRRITTLPQPLRVADDWEERNIILEDIKSILALPRVDDAKDLFHALSSDWETLSADQGILTPDPRFIGAWQQHRTTFGYTLRSELVYQLKRSLEQIEDFNLEAPTSHLLVDEYQDLNRCDLAVIKALTQRGAELFAAGDDDQSIYGFRKAHPEGIRNFLTEYPGAADLTLHECKRCDASILELGEFVARLDPRRIDKHTCCEAYRPDGELKQLRFADNNIEAEAVASICKNLINSDGLKPDDILILLRSDKNSAFSRPLKEAFDQANVPVAIDPDSEGPLDSKIGRQVLAFLRLLCHRDDHLSWVTLLELRNNRIGEQARVAIYEYACARGLTYTAAITSISNNPAQLQRFGSLLAIEVQAINTCLATLSNLLNDNNGQPVELRQVIERVVNEVVPQGNRKVLEYLMGFADQASATTLEDLLKSLEAFSADIEPSIVPGTVNILTMHKAKGLTANAVIVLAVENEHMPGRNEHEPELGDERRLLFVSLTRASKILFLTYCNRRIGQQQMSGKNPGNPLRTPSQFLRNTTLRPVDGVAYIAQRVGNGEV